LGQPAAYILNGALLLAGLAALLVHASLVQFGSDVEALGWWVGIVAIAAPLVTAPALRWLAMNQSDRRSPLDPVE
jgi:hypothetical protein